MAGTKPGHDEGWIVFNEKTGCVSGQFSLAAKPDALFRLQLRHAEQETEQAELVAPRQPGEVGDSLCDKGRGLIRPAIPARLVGSRTPILAGGCARPPAPCFGQNYIQPLYCLRIRL
jgi:hypothetical protein